MKYCSKQRNTKKRYVLVKHVKMEVLYMDVAESEVCVNAFSNVYTYFIVHLYEMLLMTTVKKRQKKNTI